MLENGEIFSETIVTNTKQITIVGAGIVGLWQAYLFARAGFPVRLIEASAEPFANGASRLAGAMIAPECEAEGAPQIVRDLGRRGLQMWRDHYPKLASKGTVVVAHARDAGDLTRFAQMTEGHEPLNADGIGRLEPALGQRFARGLFYSGEGHLEAGAAMRWLLTTIRDLGAEVSFGTRWDGATLGDVVIDCRGFEARSSLPDLRGVRGERILIETADVNFTRPVRLLHPRQPIYIVPQGNNRFVVGATVIEREDTSPVAIKSALDLLGAAYAVHPAFGEARILDLGAGIRPAFADNVPSIRVEESGRLLRVNGVYRHGFLLAPVLAQAAVRFLSDGSREIGLFDRR